MDERSKLLVEVKTLLWTAEEQTLQMLATEFLPLAEKGATRPTLVLAFEELLANASKEEDYKQQLEQLLTKFQKVKSPVKEEVKVKAEPEAMKETMEKAVNQSELIRTFRKEFKISGSIGDGSNCIGYLSFLRQIESGRKNGHSDRELVDGTIKAIQAGSKLRGYLEGRQDLKLGELQAIIRAAYKEKNATELYTDLCSFHQGTKESIQEFLFRGLELKQKIMFANEEASKPRYDRELVQHQFRESLTTGVRDSSIRNDAMRLIETFTTDEELIQGMNEVERRHFERDSKLKTKTNVSAVAAEDSVLKELRALRAEVNQLKLKQCESSSDNKKDNRQRRTCSFCAGRRLCRHCWNCGAGDHLASRCPKNGTKSATQGGR